MLCLFMISLNIVSFILCHGIYYFCTLKSQVENFFEHKIKVVQYDWGGEYQKCSKYFEQVGILHQVSSPHTHEQNGSIERTHCHIF